jgi:hypothetical protein
MTAAQFGAYDVIWIGGDCNFGATAPYDPVFANQTTWGSVATGRVEVNTGDPALHAETAGDGNGGPRVYIANEINYLGGLGATATGGMTGVSFSAGCSSVDLSKLTTFGSGFSSTGGVSYDANAITTAGAASPLLAGLCLNCSGPNLQWGQYAHEEIDSFPGATFVALVQ